MHPGPAEWWVVQVGQLATKFENLGELVRLALRAYI
jgi:hypothetical protein